jgi:uncharacterized membrane protein
MRARRLLRHLSATHLSARRLFPPRTLDAIEAAVARAERNHAGEIRFAIEASLSPRQVMAGMSPRMRALEVFAAQRVWDTEHNNGVLIYVELADRVVEIVADRGLAGRVKPEDWEGVCRLMEEHYRARRFEEGSVAGVEAVGALLAAHFPSSLKRARDAPNELPDRPTLL